MLIFCNSGLLQKIGVTRLKQLIEEKIGLPSSYQVLCYSGKPLFDGQLLSEFATMTSGATIYLAGRLVGGSESRFSLIDSSIPRSNEPCMISLEDGESVKMPCEHSISPDAIMSYAKNKIADKVHEIRCPFCDQEWPIDVLQRYSGASEEELHFLEDRLSENFFDLDTNFVQCPGCTSYCTRADQSTNSMQCPACTQRLGRSYRFCFTCLGEWKNGSNVYTCGNVNCKRDEERSHLLRECPETTIAYTGVICPSLRECPNPRCRSLIEHKEGCKHMTCTACKIDFCFVCLGLKTNGSWNCGSHTTKCTPAPRQA